MKYQTLIGKKVYLMSGDQDANQKWLLDTCMRLAQMAIEMERAECWDLADQINERIQTLKLKYLELTALKNVA